MSVEKKICFSYYLVFLINLLCLDSLGVSVMSVFINQYSHLVCPGQLIAWFCADLLVCGGKL